MANVANLTIEVNDILARRLGEVVDELAATRRERDALLDLLVRDFGIDGPARFHVRRLGGIYARGFAAKAEAIAAARREYGLDGPET